jgi:pimeloyl-ACP methyl ester carboxylesterase
MSIDLPYCPPPGAIIEIAAEEQSLAEEIFAVILEPFQPLREQFIAITGFGLDIDADDVDQSLRRLHVTRVGGGQAQPLSLLAAGRPDGARVIFIHGSPGLGEEWLPFMTAVPDGQLYLAPDRPGFGDSGDATVTDLQAQADALVPLLGGQADTPVVLVGYSYGGPVALRLAGDHPERVAGLLLIGAAADPGLEETHPLQEIAALPFFERLLPSELANSNAELLQLRDGLDMLAGDLAAMYLPVIMVQGTADNLVPASNVDYLRAQMAATPAAIMIEGADHFLPWSHPNLLAQALECLLDDARSYASGSLSSIR